MYCGGGGGGGGGGRKQGYLRRGLEECTHLYIKWSGEE